MEPLIKLAPQFRFLWDELQGPEAGAWQKFNKPYATAADAATAWDQTYERSGGAGDDRARAYATDVYRAFNGGENNLPPNAQFGYNFLIQKGMSPEQAAGVTGRLMVESHARMDPAARNTLGGGSGTYGIAQWRGDRLENLAAANNVSMDDIRNAPISTPEGRYVASSQPAPQVTRGQPMQDGLLGQFGNQPGSDQKDLPFYQRDKFKDIAGGIAVAANSLRHRPDPNLDARIAQGQQNRQQKQQTNKTVQWLQARGRDDLAEAVASGALDPRQAVGILYQKPEDNSTALMKNVEWLMGQGLSQEQALAAVKSGTTVNVGDSGPQVGTIPQGYELVQDPNTSAYRMQAIPGGPADSSAQEEAQVSARDTAGEVVITSAKRAREAAGKQDFGPTGTSTVGKMPWTDSAEVMRQTEALKSIASAEALNAMRSQSKTGGALGNVTEKELKLLSEQAGALDPNSPNYLRDLDDYERNILRTIHGKDEGDRIFQATRDTNSPADDDGWTDVGGVKIRVKK